MSLSGAKTHAELASALLRDAAGFFRRLAVENEALKEQMEENAGVFEQIAELVAADPTATLEGVDPPPGQSEPEESHTHAELAARLLGDAAGFFRTLGEQNADVKDQMDENAHVFDQVAGLLVTDPEGVLQEGG